MRYVITIVEQLDRAAAELTTDHPINNRLALILIDNATELILHRQCTDRLERDSLASGLWKTFQAITEDTVLEEHVDFPEGLREYVMTPRQRSKVKGNFLEGKLKVLEDMGDLTAAERRFIAIAHDYRNELYHVGLTHDDITRAIAGYYFLFCCDLFVRMGNLASLGPSFSSNDRFTDVAGRYLPVRNGRIDTLHVDRTDLARKLRCALSVEIPHLAETLADSARKSIKAVVEQFGFLVRDNPFRFDASKVIEIAQWQQDLTEALDREDVDGLWVDPNYRKSYARVEAALGSTWQKRHTSLPSESWMVRAAAVERETDPLAALALYQSLRNDMAYLEEATLTAAEGLDGWIQNEIDKARGK